jgi:hypothetical protein
VAEPEAPRPVPTGIANWVFIALIGLFGIGMFVTTIRTGHRDSALLFVGLPVLLAMALAIRPGRTTHGAVFKIITIFLLLAAVALHEGAICVVLAAPLVYAMAHGATALARWMEGGPKAFVLLPLLLALGGVEGTNAHLRVHPDQSVEVTRVVALTQEQVADRVERGPRPAAERSVPLRLLGMPTPERVTGTGLAPGDRWLFHYSGSAHGPGGHIVTEVVERQPGRVDFAFVIDTAITARWFRWEHASIAWRSVDSGHTEVRLTIAYRRGLDPSWYFGPLQDVLMHEGGGHLLDMLSLT